MDQRLGPHIRAIDKEDFESGRLTPGCYTPDALSAALVAYINRLQHEDVKDWHPKQQLAKERLVKGTWNLGNVYNMTDLWKWFQIYNLAFFAGLLQGACELHLIDRNEWVEAAPGLAGYCFAIYPGSEEDSKHLLSSPVAQIHIGHQSLDPLAATVTTMETLVHEMVHAIFQIFACQCGECEEIRGCGGHGPFWLHASYAIESMSGSENGQGFGPKLDLGRSSAVGGDVQRRGRKLFNEVEIRELNLDILEIIDQIKHIRQQSSTGTSNQPRGVIENGGEAGKNEALTSWSSILSAIEVSDRDHIPVRLPKNHFLKYGHMKHLSHSAEDIAAALVEYMSWEDGPMRFRAHRDFREEGSWHIGDPHNLQDIRKFFKIFDRAFFNGELAPFCKIKLVESQTLDDSRTIWGGMNTVTYPGAQGDLNLKPKKPEVVISIAIQSDKQYSTAIESYMETLLHLMTHAVFSIYRCRCTNGCQQKIAREPHHHVPWNMVACAIEQSTRIGSQPFGRGLDLDREWSLANDVYLGAPLPSDAVLRALHLDEEMMSQTTEICRKRYGMQEQEFIARTEA